MHNPMKFIEENPNSGIELTIKYFSLEESKRKVILSEVSKYLFTKYGYIVSVKELQSRGRYNTISSEILEKVYEAEEYVEKFLKNVEIIDFIKNATGIYKYVRDFALTIGTYYDKNNNPLTEQEIDDIKHAKGEVYKKISYYKKYNPKHYVIILVDHIGLLESEMEDGVKLTDWQSIGKYSKKYCLHFRDKFGFIPVNIQQQSSDKERIETNYKGETVERKLEPSLDGLANNKETQRDANVILGLFAPVRYKIREHNGYDIIALKDKYRSLSILKDRDGIQDGKTLGLFFNGAIDYFKELPKPTDVENMKKVYQYVSKLENKK